MDRPEDFVTFHGVAFLAPFPDVEVRIEKRVHCLDSPVVNRVRVPEGHEVCSHLVVPGYIRLVESVHVVDEANGGLVRFQGFAFLLCCLLRVRPVLLHVLHLIVEVQHTSCSNHVSDACPSIGVRFEKRFDILFVHRCECCGSNLLSDDLRDLRTVQPELLAHPLDLGELRSKLHGIGYRIEHSSDRCGRVRQVLLIEYLLLVLHARHVYGCDGFLCARLESGEVVFRLAGEPLLRVHPDFLSKLFWRVVCVFEVHLLETGTVRGEFPFGFYRFVDLPVFI